MMLHGEQRAAELKDGTTEARPGPRLNGEDGRSTATLWMDTRQAPEARLLAFDRWLRELLGKKLVWPTDPAIRARQIGQCQQFAEAFVRELQARGWLFDGPKLAKHIQAAVDEVAAAQKAGRVEDLWPFFRHVMVTYAGARAEELQAEAMQIGVSVASVVSRLQAGVKTLPELVAQRHQERLTDRLQKRRKADKAKQAEADQQQLF